MSFPLPAGPILKPVHLLAIVNGVITGLLLNYWVGDGVRKNKVLKRIFPSHVTTPGMVTGEVTKFIENDSRLEGVFFVRLIPDIAFLLPSSVNFQLGYPCMSRVFSKCSMMSRLTSSSEGTLLSGRSKFGLLATREELLWAFWSLKSLSKESRKVLVMELKDHYW